MRFLVESLLREREGEREKNDEALGRLCAALASSGLLWDMCAHFPESFQI
jgi:hypothetical protein